ncbi:Hypothetical predicted protein [Cloeon dipterum]|uniref:Uncharacterized protein n=1 Tax=Cloeon dipterum TaxID=197152 RepID=A0A8S1E2K2_9INSE|nr:Hypothetical predicted protein [Cloeon dipterum]
MEKSMPSKEHPGSESPDEREEASSSGVEDGSPDASEDLDETEDTEFDDLNEQLDQINSFMDDLEQKNDSLQAKLRQLLAMSREERLAAQTGQMTVAEGAVQQPEEKS